MPGLGSDFDLDGAAGPEAGTPDLIPDNESTIGKDGEEQARRSGTLDELRSAVQEAAEAHTPAQSVRQLQEAIVDDLIDDGRDVRIGENLWRGAQADGHLPLSSAT